MAAFVVVKESYNTYWISYWVVPRVGLGSLKKRNPLLLQGKEQRFLDCPTRRPVTTSTELSRLLRKKSKYLKKRKVRCEICLVSSLIND